MKTLYLRRHSIKDGHKDTIGPKGLALAHREGRIAGNIERYSALFHGPLVRTAQTALAFLQGYTDEASEYCPGVKPVIFGLGDDELFKKMADDAFKEAVKSGNSNFQALLKAHGRDNCDKWAIEAYETVCRMFESLVDDETGIGFFHSPTIELAASWIYRGSGLPEKYQKLNDLEGLIFEQDDDGGIRVVDKITAEPLEQ